MIKLRGLSGSHHAVDHQINYVIANDPTEAYQKVRSWLDEKDYGFWKDRELNYIELMAEDSEFTDCGNMLFL